MNAPKTLAGLVAFLLVGMATAADPVPKDKQVVPPKIVASPGVKVREELPPVVPPPGTPTPLDAGKFLFLEVTGYTGEVTWDFSTTGIVALLPDAPAGAAKDYYPGIKQGESSPQWHKSPSKNATPCLGVSDGSVTIAAWGTENGKAKKIAELLVQVGHAPQPPPKPKPDDPDKPKPPVTSFRVILGFESGATMTQAQINVLYGSVVENYLNASCTGGKAGWRRRDKDAAGDGDATFSAMWKAIQPAITTVPFAAVEVNGKIEIIPLEPTPAAMVEKFKTYNEGK